MPPYPGFIGGSNRVRSVNVNGERTINWLPEAAPGTPKVPLWLSPTPGTLPFAVLNAGPVRALQSMDGRAFAVGGTGFYELFAGGAVTLHGLVDDDANSACISSNGSNGFQLLITSGGENWIFDLVTNTLELLNVLNPGPATPTQMSLFSDGYFIALRKSSNEFQLSALYNGLSWDPLDVFQVSTVADQLVAIVENHRDLWLFGSQTTSVWSNTGGDVVYEPIPGVKIDQGCAAGFSAVRVDNTILWLGQGEAGARMVWRANGYTPQRVSTHAVEFALGKAPRVDDAVAWSYQDEGHTFYALYVPSLATIRGFGTTWVFDVATEEWHERALWDSTALDWQPHPGRCHTYAFGKHLIGDRASPAIYDLRLDLANDTLVVIGA
jgi:hypothetical protein